jgi:chromosome partitioning protein
VIILIGGEKGGSGKTTIATNLAALRVQSGRDVLLVDTDVQGSASYWAASRDDAAISPRVACIQKFGRNLALELKDLARRYQDVVIDAGGRDSPELRASLVAADRAFIPIQASQFDVWTLQRMEELVASALTFNAALTAMIVLNRASPNPVVGEVEEVKEIAADFQHIGLCDVILRDRIAYRKAAKAGLAVTELDRTDSKANTEIRRLYQWVFASNL